MQTIRLPFVLTIMAACSVICFGQGSKTQLKLDLSGTWEFDHKRSNVGKSTSSSSSPEQIKITHIDPELKIRRQILVNGQREERELTYYTDERGETTNPTTAYVTTNTRSQSGPLETKSKTSWSGNKIVTRSFRPVTAAGRTAEFEQIDEWKLSDEGRVLIHTIRILPTTRGGIFIMAPDKKRVYNRV